MFRTARLLLALLVATSASARVIQPGDVVLLKSNTGRYLSADGAGGRLSLTGNTSSWEQWAYSPDATTSLVSFHGTTLIAVGAPVHEPRATGDAAIVPLQVLQLIPPAWTVIGSAEDGGAVLLRAPSGQGICESSSYRNGLALTSADPNQAACRWTISIVASPAPNRLPIAEAQPQGYDVRYRLKSAHGTYLQWAIPYGATVNAQFSIPVTHLAELREVKIRNVNNLPNFRWGESIMIGTMHPQSRDNWVSLTDYPTRPGPELVEYKRFEWTLTDPTRKGGQRVQKGAKFCIRGSDGRNISADPANATLTFSSNCSAWEWWTLEPVQ